MHCAIERITQIMIKEYHLLVDGNDFKPYTRFDDDIWSSTSTTYNNRGWR